MTQVGKAPPSPEMTISGLTRGQVFGEDDDANQSPSPALPDVRPAPQAGCFVSRLKLSKDSAQSDLRHRAFRTVAIAPSSGVLEIPAQAKAGAEIKSKGVRRLALRVGRISHARAGLRIRPICTTLPQQISGDPVFSACLKNPVNALNNELLDLRVLVQGDLL